MSFNPLVWTVFDCRRSAGLRSVVGTAVAALSILLAPAASAQANFYLATAPGIDEIAADLALDETIVNTFCLIQGPAGGSCGSPLVFTATSPATPSAPFNATFSLHNNTAGASFVGPNTCVGVTSCNAVVTTSQSGSFVIRVTLTFSGGVQKVCQQLVTVSDNTPPSIICPADTTVPCGGSVDPSITGTPTVTDCSPFTVTFSDAPGVPGCAGVTIVRTWTAMDSGGLIATCTQTITPVSQPSITCPGPVNVQCYSQVPQPNVSSVTASNPCGGQVTVTHLGDSATNGTSSCNNVITRTYQVTNGCGATATCTQVFNVNDTTPPSITCPGPVSVQCVSLVPPPNTGSVSASDNCGGFVQLTHLGDSASNGTSNCNNVITRTYQAVDTCGNVNTCAQMITVNDSTPPTITCPGPVSVQCFSQVPGASTTAVIASDNCGGPVTVTHVGDAASNGTSNCNNVITRTYQAVDGCGNVNTCAQTITVNDTTPPFVNCPGPVAVQCFSLVPPVNTGSVSASDNCGGLVTITHLGDSASNGTSSCFNVITRTYQAADSCGNVNTCIQTINVNDTTPPAITCPGPVSVQCFSLVPAPSTTAVITSDNCGGLVTVIHVGDSATNGTSSCNNVITRTYQATDSCGNVNSCTQTITVNDTTPPTITCPGPVSVQCFSLVPPVNTGAVVTSDNCGGLVTVTHVGDSASNGTSNCFNVITRTYQAVDACGNTNTCIQTISVNDTTPPTITCPGPVGVQCFSLVPAPSTTAVIASDNCGGLVTVIHVGDSATGGTSNCNNVITRTYQATDPCGNVNTCTQTITVNDTTAPTITCPGPQAFQCFAQIPAPNPGSVVATDNCGGLVTVTHLGDSASNGTSSCLNIVTRTYQATDTCGNVNTCIQTFTINDTTPPVITCPPDFTGPCGTPTDPGTTGTATATDNCNPTPLVTFTDLLSGGPCPTVTEVITRTWTANDGCNQVTCVQIITLDPPPPINPGCSVDLGGGCGTPAPVLGGSLNANTFQFLINNAAPNSPGFLLAHLGPIYGSPTQLGPGCLFHLSTSFPPTVNVGSVLTDAGGNWLQSFNVPSIPNPLNVKVQGVIFPAGFPPGTFNLTNALQMFRPCPPCTYTLALWAANSGPSSVNLATNYVTVFAPANPDPGMDVGVYGPGNGTLPPNGFRWTPDATGLNALKLFLFSSDGGSLNMPIPQDAINPVNSLNSGTICRMTAVLRLNVEFNAAGFLGSPIPGFGNLIYVNPFSSLNGFTVSQILALCDQLLAGTAAPPPGYTVTSFTDLLEDLAASFSNCVPSPWASAFLNLPGP
jgi:hypothetical protein